MLSNNVPENFVAFNKRKRCFRWDNNLSDVLLQTFNAVRANNEPDLEWTEASTKRYSPVLPRTQYTNNHAHFCNQKIFETVHYSFTPCQDSLLCTLCTALY